MDIIQRASKDPRVFTYGGSAEYPGGTFISVAGIKMNRLENAADQCRRVTDLRNEVFKFVGGWNAAENVKAEPVVPIRTSACR